MVKNPFPDPIKYKKRAKPFSYDPRMEEPFKGPTKEQATTGRFMEMGDDYGVGFRTPLGKETARPITQGSIPQKSHAYIPEDGIRLP